MGDIMKGYKNIIWGLLFIIVGIIVFTNSFGITNITIFFDGWWTLFIIIPSLVSLVNSTLLRFFTVEKFWTIKPILADLSVTILIGSIGYFIKPKKQFRYFGLMATLFTLICFINSIYTSLNFNYNLTIFSSPESNLL